MSQKLLCKDFVLVVVGQIISLFGNGILRFALPLYLLEITGSSAIFGAVSALSFLPLVVLMPVGGIVADRVNKRNIMVMLDFLTAMLVLWFYISLPHLSLVPLLVATLMVLYSISGLYQPAVSASIPLLLGPEVLLKGNSVVSSIHALSNLLSPMIGGMLFGSFGITPILILAIVCFFLSSVLEMFIQIPHAEAKKSQGIVHTVKKEFGESMVFIFHQKPKIAKMILAACALNAFVSALLIIGMPVLITERLGLSTELYGVSQGVFALGGLFGGVLTGALASKVKIENLYKWFFALAAALIPFALSMQFAQKPLVSFFLITASVFFVMANASFLSISIMSYVQNETDKAMQGKVISVLLTLSLCAQPLGQLLYGFAFEYGRGLEWLIAGLSLFAVVLLGTYMKKIF